MLAGDSSETRRGRPRQTDLCRAVSAAYYALFHALSRNCADMLAGSTRANRSQPAWRQTYRPLEYGLARNQCRNQAVMLRFPLEIQWFGELFVVMQQIRHHADYDPMATFSRFLVMRQIDQAEEAIERFNSVERGQRRAFAIYVLFGVRQ